MATMLSEFFSRQMRFALLTTSYAAGYNPSSFPLIQALIFVHYSNIVQYS